MGQIGDKTNELENASPKITVGKASAEVLGENPEREGLHISNGSSTAVIYLGLGEEAIVGRGIAVVFADGGWDGKIGPLIWTGSIFAISTEEGSSLALVEV
jgi:hypothetical protein